MLDDLDDFIAACVDNAGSFMTMPLATGGSTINAFDASDQVHIRLWQLRARRLGVPAKTAEPLPERSLAMTVVGLSRQHCTAGAFSLRARPWLGQTVRAPRE
jgi:hypothetical protein